MPCASSVSGSLVLTRVHIQKQVVVVSLHLQEAASEVAHTPQKCNKQQNRHIKYAFTFAVTIAEIIL